MHFENFQPAVIPLEAQTLNASTAFLKHFFKRWQWKIHKNWKWPTCPILSFWDNIEMFETCFRLQNAFWRFSACSNLSRSPNFKRLYSLTERLFKTMMMKNLPKLKTSSIHHTFTLKPFWGVLHSYLRSKHILKISRLQESLSKPKVQTPLQPYWATFQNYHDEKSLKT